MSTKQSGPNEEVIQEYFDARSGWTVKKLPSGKKGKAADFRICNDTICFLCEAKTIESDRANFPYNPLEYYLEQRERRKAEIENWLRENPNKRLVLRKDEAEFIHSDEIEFSKKYRHIRRRTKSGFDQFAQNMRKHFAESHIKDLPYILRLDSNDLYQPTLDEQHAFFAWLEKEVSAIHRGEPNRQWHIQPWSNRIAEYSTSYQVHKRTHEHDPEAVYGMVVVGPAEAGNLEVQIHSYGTLNLDRIISNVETGITQLEKSALREEDQQIPRVIALALTSGIDEWDQFSSCITSLLKEHHDLSAIAVLKWTPDGTPPSRELGLLAWLEFGMTTPIVPSFIVYHNSWLQSVKPLSPEVFNDKWSVQLCPIR